MFAHRVKILERSPFYKVLALADNIKDCIYLFAGEPDFPTPGHIIKAGQAALAEGYTHYGSARGEKKLRSLIAQKIEKEYGAIYDPADEILITSGAQAGIHSAVMSLVEPGDEAIIFSPYYPAYLADILIADGKPVIIKLQPDNDYLPDIDTLARHITRKTKLLILHSPNNPTGKIYPRSLLSSIVELACQKNFFIISDEVYEKIIYQGNEHHSILSFPEAKKRTIMINSFSKTYSMTGWRVGYLVAERTILEQILKYHETFSICVNVPAQRAAIAALSDPQDCVKQMVAEYEKRCTYLVKELESIPALTFATPEGAFYLFIDIREFGLTSQQMVEFLVREGILVIGGDAFGQDGFIRLSFSASMKNLEIAMDRLRRAVDKLLNK
jgi:aspartate/methionine/tyrosine aminotransferase